MEEHLDKVKGSVYQRAKVVKEYRPQSKTGLKLKKGQLVFVHSAEGGKLTITPHHHILNRAEFWLKKRNVEGREAI